MRKQRKGVKEKEDMTEHEKGRKETKYSYKTERRELNWETKEGQIDKIYRTDTDKLNTSWQKGKVHNGRSKATDSTHDKKKEKKRGKKYQKMRS